MKMKTMPFLMTGLILSTSFSWNVRAISQDAPQALLDLKKAVSKVTPLYGQLWNNSEVYKNKTYHYSGVSFDNTFLEIHNAMKDSKYRMTDISSGGGSGNHTSLDAEVKQTSYDSFSVQMREQSDTSENHDYALCVNDSPGKSNVNALASQELVKQGIWFKTPFQLAKLCPIKLEIRTHELDPVVSEKILGLQAKGNIPLNYSVRYDISGLSYGTDPKDVKIRAVKTVAMDIVVKDTQTKREIDVISKQSDMGSIEASVDDVLKAMILGGVLETSTLFAEVQNEKGWGSPEFKSLVHKFFATVKDLSPQDTTERFFSYLDERKANFEKRMLNLDAALKDLNDQEKLLLLEVFLIAELNKK